VRYASLSLDCLLGACRMAALERHWSADCGQLPGNATGEFSGPPTEGRAPELERSKGSFLVGLWGML
jgi:hypothetical protein